MIIRNALIDGVKIMTNGDGTFISVLHLNYDGGADGVLRESFGYSSSYFNLDSEIKNLHGYFIHRVLETVDVVDWDSLTGKAVRVALDEQGHIGAIGHIVRNTWFYPKKEFTSLEKDLAARAEK